MKEFEFTGYISGIFDTNPFHEGMYNLYPDDLVKAQNKNIKHKIKLNILVEELG